MFSAAKPHWFWWVYLLFALAGQAYNFCLAPPTSILDASLCVVLAPAFVGLWAFTAQRALFGRRFWLCYFYFFIGIIVLALAAVTPQIARAGVVIALGVWLLALVVFAPHVFALWALAFARATSLLMPHMSANNSVKWTAAMSHGNLALRVAAATYLKR